MINMNLQMFGNSAADSGDTSTSGDTTSTQDSFGGYISGDNDVSDIQLVGENDGTELPGEKVATSQADTKQDPKLDAAFAKMRKEKETYEKRHKELDTWVEKTFGKDYGIKTMEEYKEMMDKQLRDEKEAELREQGYDPELIKEVLKLDPKLSQILDDDSVNSEEAQAQKQAEADKQLVDDYKALASEFPGLVNQPEDIQKEVWDLYDGGMTLSQAYAAVNYKAILNHSKNVGQQQALNKINSKAHLKVEGDGAGDTTDTYMPQDTLSMYLDMGMSKKEAFAHYKKLYG